MFYRLDLFDRAVGVVGCDGVWRLAGGSLRRLWMVSTEAGELRAHNRSEHLSNTLATLIFALRDLKSHVLPDFH